MRGRGELAWNDFGQLPPEPTAYTPGEALVRWIKRWMERPVETSSERTMVLGGNDLGRWRAQTIDLVSLQLLFRALLDGGRQPERGAGSEARRFAQSW
jgi:hypothetical protein